MSEKIRLNHPITVDGQLIEEVSLRRPKVRDIEKAEKIKNDFQKSVAMIADLTSLSPDEVREMDTEDFTAIGNMVGEFMGASAS